MGYTGRIWTRPSKVAYNLHVILACFMLCGHLSYLLTCIVSCMGQSGKTSVTKSCIVFFSNSIYRMIITSIDDCMQITSPYVFTECHLMILARQIERIDVSVNGQIQIKFRLTAKEYLGEQPDDVTCNPKKVS